MAPPEEGRYSRVTRRMWNDAKFRKLTAPPPCGQALWFRLLTGPELGCIPGLFPAFEAGLAQAMRWPLEGFREAFQEVFALGFAEADWDCGVVWVPRAVEHNPPTSPNVVRGWRLAWLEIPECDLKDKAGRALKAFGEGLGEGFRKAFGEVFGKGSTEGLALALSLSGSGSGSGTRGGSGSGARVAKGVPLSALASQGGPGPDPPGNGSGKPEPDRKPETNGNGHRPIIREYTGLVNAMRAVAGVVRPEMHWAPGPFGVQSATEFFGPPEQDDAMTTKQLVARTEEIRARAEKFFRLKDESEFSVRNFLKRWNELAPAKPKNPDPKYRDGYEVL